MNIVLYTDELEPITILDLPMYAIDYLKEGRHWNIACPIEPQVRLASVEPNYCTFKKVTIWAEQFRKGNNRTWMLFTTDEENALLLKSSTLPGQDKEWKERYREGFKAGLLAGILRN
jgi:hypothetical protein